MGKNDNKDSFKVNANVYSGNISVESAAVDRAVDRNIRRAEKEVSKGINQLFKKK